MRHSRGWTLGPEGDKRLLGLAGPVGRRARRESAGRRVGAAGWGWGAGRGLAHPGAVAGAGGLLPDRAGADLEAFGPVVLLLVEQAVGEGVLAGEMRVDAELAGGLAGDHGVLVVADDRLDLLHLPGERAGGLAGRRAGGLGRVAGPPGRLAGLVQGDVPGLAARRLPGPAHPPVRLPVRLAHGGREDVTGR